LTIVRGDLRLIPEAIGLARSTMRLIRGNLAWAFGYNLALLPLAAGLLRPSVGLSLSPEIASVAMALSSIAVVANSLRLRRISISQ
jgi:Cu+-exporting ATPase